MPKAKKHRKKLEEVPKRREGRPSIYSKEMGTKICNLLMQGKGLTVICRRDDTPTIQTIFNWLNPLHKSHVPEFLEFYRLAREIQAEVLADQTNEIADDGTNDTYMFFNKKTGEYETRINYDIVARSALRVKTKQWLAAHLLPKKFSDKMELTGANGKELVPTPTNIIVNFVKPDKEKNG